MTRDKFISLQILLYIVLSHNSDRTNSILASNRCSKTFEREICHRLLYLIVVAKIRIQVLAFSVRSSCSIYWCLFLASVILFLLFMHGLFLL